MFAKTGMFVMKINKRERDGGTKTFPPFITNYKSEIFRYILSLLSTLLLRNRFALKLFTMIPERFVCLLFFFTLSLFYSICSLTIHNIQIFYVLLVPAAIHNKMLGKYIIRWWVRCDTDSTFFFIFSTPLSHRIGCCLNHFVQVQKYIVCIDVHQFHLTTDSYLIWLAVCRSLRTSHRAMYSNEQRQLKSYVWTWGRV